MAHRSSALALALLALLARPAAASPLGDDLLVGLCDPVAMAAAKPATDGERLGVAWCDAGHADLDRTVTVLQPLRGGPLEPYARLIEAEARLLANDPTEAAKLLAQPGLSGSAADRARMLRGRALVEARRYDEAREVLRPLLEGAAGSAGRPPDPWGADPAEVRWWLAQGAVLRGETGRAVPVYQALWARNPTSPYADKAAAELAGAGHPVPDPASEEGRALMLERVRTLEKLRRYEDALALRDQLPAGPPRVEARAAFNAHAYARAATAFARIEDRGPEEQFDYALATSRAGDYPRAAGLYQELYTRWPTHAKADFASFKVGYLAYDAGELERAVGLLRDHLTRYPSSTHADEARWFIGWSLLRQGRSEDADAALGELVARHPGSGLATAARYWRARLKGMAGDAAGEQRALEAVLNDDPDSGYAWFASWRLGRRWSASGVTASFPPPPSLQGEAWTRGTALAEAGLDGWARDALAPLIPTARAGGEPAALALATALTQAGAYQDAIALARPYCGSPWKASSDRAKLQVCWPRPAAPVVGRLAREGGLDPNLPYAIMNTESGLDPAVTSPVGARGLMQLMPDVAALAHEKRFPGRAIDLDALYRPTYNAALGTTELASLWSDLSGAGTAPPLPLVIAGYNGGANAVKRWLAADPRSVQGDWFAENIGFTETRQYVRRVLGYLQVYRYIYGDEG